VAIFDADHVPTRSFLQLTMGWFERDAKLALMQTPQHFYSPDPFERNLDQFRNVPSENELFYGVVQDGNDLWNATSFCGSCAVLRREALDEIGGLATETVTEDAHTSLRLQKAGWSTAYINIPQAAGLATERLRGHIRQRVRWARGMIQILRIENPLFGRGLKLTQRLCYFNATAHFLFALPRLVFLTAPLIYLLFGRANLPGFWAAIVAYAAPHLVMLHLTHSRIQGRHRHSFWNEIYETVLAPYILLPTLGALLRPHKGRFNVTTKGQIVAAGFFDRRTARPFLFLLLANLVGLLCAIPRAHLFAASAAMGWKGTLLNLPHRMYDGGHPGVIGINVAWTLFNVLLLSVATAVAWESQQRRRAVRVSVEIPAGVVLPDGSTVQGLTGDLSSTGVLLRTGASLGVRAGDPVRIVLPVLDGDASLPASVIAVEDGELRARFEDLSLQEEEALTMVLYSRADSWLGWGESRERDHPLRSLARILGLALRGLRQTIYPRGPRPGRGRLATSIVPMLVAAMLLPMLAVRRAEAQEAQANQTESASSGIVRAENSAAKSGVAKTGAPAVLPGATSIAAPIVSMNPAPVLSANVGKPNPRSASARFEGVSRPDVPHGPGMHAKRSSAQTIEVDAVPSATVPSATVPSATVPSVASEAARPQLRVAANDWGARAHPLALALLPGATDAGSPVAAEPPASNGAQDSAAARTAGVVTSGGMAQARYVASRFYHAQVLLVWGQASGLAALYPWALVLMVALQAFLIAVLLRSMLRRRARERLLGNI
jgi:cellulose synthase (UDP-forming)